MLSYYYYDFLIPDDYEKRGFARIAHLRSVDPDTSSTIPILQKLQKEIFKNECQDTHFYHHHPDHFLVQFFLHLSNATTAFLSIYFCSDDTTSYPPV